MNTPDAQPGELVVQGSRIHRSLLYVSLDSVPQNAVIIGGTLRIAVDNTGSTYGLFGRDEVISVRYVQTSGSPIEIASRGDSAGVYVFTNIGPLLELIRRNGGEADLIIKPTGIYESWRMNRLRLYSLASEAYVRPRLTVAYTIPSVLVK